MAEEIKLSRKERAMLEAIELVIDGVLSPAGAAARLGVSERTIRRRIDRYIQYGKGGLVHKSRGMPAHNALAFEDWLQVARLYHQKYNGYNWTHFWQKLREVEGIEIAYSTVYATLTQAGFVSPKAQKQTRQKLHPSRSRRATFGELVQIDASKHPWFDDFVCQLHLGIDDATSQVLGGYFSEQETLDSYLHLFAQIILEYGVPRAFYADRRTVFASMKTTDSRLDRDTSTQFRMIAARLGVEQIHVSSVPQAKGRVERAFGTFQDRLISEMRTASIHSIKAANTFLPSFIADHNRRYALDDSQLTNNFKALPEDIDINLALAKVTERIVTPGLTISYKGKFYAPYDKVGRVQVPPHKKVYILKTLDDRLFLSYLDHLYTLIRCEDMRFPCPKDLVDKIYTPPANHPWKQEVIKTLIRKYRRVS